MFQSRAVGQRGFTIMELLIVIVVFGVLTVVILRSIQDLHLQARNTERRVDIENLHGKLEAHWQSHGSYPASLDELGLLPGLSSQALLDPNDNLIVVSASESSNKPTSGLAHQQPDSGQYLYSGYGCPVPEEISQTQSEDSQETEVQAQPIASQPSCDHYVLYSWIEKAGADEEPVYEKASLN